jgi:hypothetical protein
MSIVQARAACVKTCLEVTKKFAPPMTLRDNGINTMDVLKMITELRAERAALDEALLVLERLAASHGAKRRGRPPAWLQAVKVTGVASGSDGGGRTRVFSAETRRKMALAQKKRWAAKKSQSGG